jgi:hypothetical protein
MEAGMSLQAKIDGERMFTQWLVHMYHGYLDRWIALKNEGSEEAAPVGRRFVQCMRWLKESWQKTAEMRAQLSQWLEENDPEGDELIGEIAEHMAEMDEAARAHRDSRIAEVT